MRSTAFLVAELAALLVGVAFLVDLYRGAPTFPGQKHVVGQTLAHIQNPEAARTLASVAAQAIEPGLIEASAYSLAKIGTPAAVQGLVDTLEHIGTADTTLRQSLLVALSRVNTSESAAFRAQLLKEDLPSDLLQALTMSHRLRHSS